MKTKEDTRAKDQARAQVESIIEMVKDLRAAERDEDAREDATQAINEDPLSLRLRGDWHNAGEKAEDVEFEILLCTGGPAVRIIGELDEHNEPDKARVEYQDWFTPWTALTEINEEESEAVLEYCRQFYFGD